MTLETENEQEGSWWKSKGKKEKKERPAYEAAPETIARAKELKIRQKDIDAGGGIRKDSLGDRYWFNLDQLVELDELDLAIDDEDEFWDAVDELIAREGLEVENKRVRWDNKQSWNSGSYMSGWWKSWGYSGSSATATKLALALGVIQSTVQVINNTGRPWRVSLASEENGATPTSYTDYDAREVVVSPSALVDKDLSEEAGIEITTGYGLHEASHTEFSEARWGDLRNPKPLEPMAVAGLLANLLEDVRIEKITGENFPGFANYFVTMNAYLWKTAVSKVAAKAWGPELQDKLNAVIQIVKWPVQTEPTARANKELSDEFDWFTAWLERYISGKVEMRQSLEDAIDHLKMDPETKKQMDKQTAAEKALGDFEKMLQDQFEKAVKQAMDQLGTMQPCSTRDDGVKLKRSLGDEVERLVQEEYQVEQVPQPVRYPDQKGAVSNIEISKPELTPKQFSRTPLLDRLRYAFRFRKARPMYSNRLLKSGELDEGEMWRAATADFRVFEQRVIEADPDTQITLLIDCSGSMMGVNVERATMIGRTMLEVLKDMKGVRIRVRAHSTALSSNALTAIYRIWEPGDPVGRVGAIDQLRMAGNYDAFALAWCSEEMLKDQRPHEDMVLFIISDGRPNGIGLAGVTGEQEIRKVQTHYAKKGVTTIQIAIDPSVTPNIQAQMYDHFIPFKSADELPAQLTQTLIKLFGG